MKRFFLSLAAAAVLAAVSADRVEAQALGQVTLQTIQATVANNVTCTGAAQNFRTDQNITNFRNIGQTAHLATASSNATAFQMEIDGIDNLGVPYRLSDLQLGVPSSAKGGIVVTANGYMTNIQISVTCTAAATFSISYSGSFSPAPPNFAGALLNAVDKLPFQNGAANANSSVTFQSPTGNSSGTIIFQYAAAGPSGSTIAAQCLTNNGTNLALYTFTATTASTPQLFNVTAGSCPFVTLTYTSGGASATTYNLEYVFNASGTTQAIGDPCLSPTTNKLSAPITFAAVGTTQIVGLVAGQKIYPCSLELEANADSSSIETFQWEYGTGASCGTGTTVLSGPMKQNSTNGAVAHILSGGTFMNLPVSNALCMVVAQVSGAVINVNGVLGYVQQ